MMLVPFAGPNTCRRIDAACIVQREIRRAQTPGSEAQLLSWLPHAGGSRQGGGGAGHEPVHAAVDDEAGLGGSGNCRGRARQGAGDRLCSSLGTTDLRLTLLHAIALSASANPRNLCTWSAYNFRCYLPVMLKKRGQHRCLCERQARSDGLEQRLARARQEAASASTLSADLEDRLRRAEDELETAAGVCPAAGASDLR